ncbi:Putative L-lactate dehydrogenase operon regulatory protein [Jannaschia seosinensis]|uniref:Putative L-lactate dehydrogenase operon regulatory protein n=1 Tax=Jannaschia seosinensis TaxID=313367 RepID=A0A0M7B9F0_9RHOB|nr:FCD domain-containing protein [Jannaschia seosinensis]CUH24106.1 Putative L-lactate dehydrogenase operon regulatory protein [Jannaschia seosinensis]
MDATQRQPMQSASALLGDVPRHSVREVIAGKIAALISSGILSVGDALPGERELAVSLSVSRETIRGAIAILAEHGILRVAQGMRTVVATTDLSRMEAPVPMPRLEGPYSLASVHETRLLVERRIAAEAARRATPGLISAMRRSLGAQEACGDDAVGFLLADREFHGLLYRASENDVLADIALSLHNHLLDHRRRIVAQPGAIAISIADHQAILSGIEARDVEAAIIAVATHTTRIYDTTRSFLEERTG